MRVARAARMISACSARIGTAKRETHAASTPASASDLLDRATAAEARLHLTHGERALLRLRRRGRFGLRGLFVGQEGAQLLDGEHEGFVDVHDIAA